MVKRCVKCKGRLVQGAETCIICGKPVVQPVSIPNVAPIPPSRPSAAISGPYIRFVTAPGGRRIEDSSTVKSYKTRWGELNNSR